MVTLTFPKRHFYPFLKLGIEIKTWPFQSKDFFDFPVHLTNTNSEDSQMNLNVVRDDLHYFGLGTKVRKISGLVKWLTSEGINQVVLRGSLHGNFLASYSYILYNLGFLVRVFAYTRDKNLLSPNRILIKHHSHELRIFHSFVEMNESISIEEKQMMNANLYDSQKQQSYYLPTYGIHPTALDGLSILWKHPIFTTDSPKTIFLEIGSGVTFLSALSSLSNQNVSICGISVGEPRDKWLLNSDTVASNLNLSVKLNQNTNFPQTSMPNIYILNPMQKSRFASIKKDDSSVLKLIYQRYGLLIEPVYGLKTWEYLLNPSELPKDLPKPWIYLHQGGQLNHMDTKWMLES